MQKLSLSWISFCLLQVLLPADTSHIPECPIIVDVVFMIDTSKTMSNNQLDNSRRFITSFLPHLQPSTEGTNVAIITFANSVSSNHAFSDEQDITTLKQSLNHISSVVPFDANTILAFNEAHRLLNRERKQRMRRVIMFVSSGLYQYPEMATTSSQTLKDDGISIISLGLRSPQGVIPVDNVNINQLQKVASSVRHVVVTSNPSDVASFSDLVSLICTVDREPEVFVSSSEGTKALVGHVISTVLAWDDFSCGFSCLHTKNCYSFNFRKRTRVCELNHSNKIASPGDLVIDFESVYYELVLK